MNIRELKDKITNGTLDDSFFILKWSDNNFICNQYINEIARIHNLTKNYVEGLQYISNSFFGMSDDLNIYVCDEFKYELENYKDLKNTIVICKKIEDKTLEKCKDYVIEVPKLIGWQIEDYLKTLVPGLKKDEIEWLCSICKNDVYRITNEAKKINSTSKENQEKLFKMIISEDGYSDLNPLTIFDFTNACLKKDKKGIVNILKSLEKIDVEPQGVLVVLRKNFKNILSVQMNPNATPQLLGVTPKQFYGIKYSCGYFSNGQLIELFELVNDIDYQLKSGNLEYNRIIPYVVTRLF